MVAVISEYSWREFIKVDVVVFVADGNREWDV